MQNALKAALQHAAAFPVGARSPEGMPLVRTAFLRPGGDYWLGWPGTAWDVEGATKRFTELLAKFGHELDVRVEAGGGGRDVRWGGPSLSRKLVAGVVKKSPLPYGSWRVEFYISQAIFKETYQSIF